MKSLRTCLSVMLIVFIVAGCAPGAAPEPTTPPQNTEVPSATLPQFTPSITTTPTQSITPIPPPTRRVATLQTSTITMTPLASFTARPTRSPTGTITGTNTLYVRPPFGGPTWTPTPAPFKCDVASTFPPWGQQYKPRTNFIAKWRLYNSGENMWHMDDILDGYVSGTKMQNPDRGNRILDHTVYAEDYLNIQIQMHPPKEPGIYTITWGLRKTNKKDFFCTFSVTIEVVRK